MTRWPLLRRTCRLAALLLLPGCATLQPWERAALMTRVMEDPGDAGAAAFEAHVLDTREPLTGATVVGGAPCGCN